ncbi:hypothetical protein LTS16_007702 [Friedmanniomyces endolithicus]|nr:hypothetical protein LTS00_004846 [Friedmanniomyces endolithicus]KAK0309833.1 hypothetical protein LTR01_004030 [Friedmanniomyces endolithicus]KAK0832843.1 hypothetical protein LTR73_001928 [Friedmanniomyces endolithicus]KAK1010095.1 hypothetical protein LTS01_001767 [Friedmanniomyces endolithicus]KAK1018624.1 hypothetical protein LTR54_001511 [Friedmanniomyces endolithicus]
MELQTLLASLAAGVASHVLYFNRYECHLHALLYSQILLTTWAAAFLALTTLYDYTARDALTAASSSAGLFLAGAYSSLLIYRIFLNPLNRFPGPWLAKISSLYWSSRLSKMDSYLQLQALHKQHGPIVRIGSGDLSIIHPECIDLAYGPDAQATKSAHYDKDLPVRSMQAMRSKAAHGQRRKIWAPAFSDKALRAYETKIDSYNDKYVRRVTESIGTPVNASNWFNLYSFDAMGSLAFGKDYHMLESGERLPALELLKAGLKVLAFYIPAWAFRLLLTIPGLAGAFHTFVKFCVAELDWRVEHAAEIDEKGGKDILSWLLKSYEGVEKPQADVTLQADTRLIIIAGVQTLRNELRPLTEGRKWSDVDIRQAPHLNGAINEALRLYPPISSALPRLTAPEGMRIGDTWIPGNTTIRAPQYVMGRDEASYEDAEKFVPERWYSKPHMVKRKEAFAPFSVGPMGCIGKNLALTELRTLTARLVLEFDVQLAPGQEKVIRMKDHVTVDVGDIFLMFTKAS